MRELSQIELTQTAAAGIAADLGNFIANGVNHQEKTLGIIALSAGTVIGGMIPGGLVPFLAIGYLVGWGVYDWKYGG